MSTPVRVAVADDDALVRAGLAAILRHDPGVEVVLEAADGGALVRGLLAVRADVVLLDVRMSPVDGLATLDALAGARIDVPVAMLSTFSDDRSVTAAVARGAKGFLLKSDAPADLIRAVHALADGGAVFSPRVAAWFVRAQAVDELRARHDARDRVGALTDRQRAVLDHLATGAGNAEIAARLHLSEGTVKQYLREVFRVLGVENRVQAALVGFQARAG